MFKPAEQNYFLLELKSPLQLHVKSTNPKHFYLILHLSHVSIDGVDVDNTLLRFLFFKPKLLNDSCRQVCLQEVEQCCKTGEEFKDREDKNRVIALSTDVTEVISQ